MSRVKFVALLALALAILCGLIASTQCQSSHGYRGPYYDDYNDEVPSANDAENTQPLPPNRLGPVSRPYAPPAPQTPSQDPNVIQVPRLGLVRGNVGYKYIGNRRVSSFLGLRYAQVVNGGLGRFQKAAEADYSRTPVIDASAKSRNCPQYPDLQQVMEAEARRENVDDCLTLDVYTPNITASLPVIVFVHGEMLFDGSSEEAQPEYLLEAGDVVLVSLNYRLAPFGFFSTLTDEMPGNVALADIHMGLEWVQKYVGAFGGDAQRVTLMGQAGGATLVHALSLSAKAQGLFEKLILQSGTALNPYFIDESPVATMNSFAYLAGCLPKSHHQNQSVALSVNRCFERLSTSELLSIFKRHWLENERLGLRNTGGFKLIVGDRLGYLPQHPSAAVQFNTYPMIAGVAKDAGAFIMSRFYNQVAAIRSNNISEYIDVVLKHVAHSSHHNIWRNWAIQHIFDENEIRNPTASTVAQGLLELVNLILYRGPLIDSIRYTSANYPTYLYVFDYRGEFHRFDNAGNNPLPFGADATLSDDSIYTFPYPEEVSQLNAADKRMSELISGMWVRFAEYGVPAATQNQWPNVANEYGPFVRFTKDARPVELDYHFGDGIPVPNLYPQYFTTTTTQRPTRPTTTTTTTTTTTSRPYPYYSNNYNYRSHPNYRNEQNPNSQYRQYPQQQQQQQHYQRYPNYQSQYGQQQ